jgi:hypothetical protein
MTTPDPDPEGSGAAAPFALVECGLLAPDDPALLPDGLLVAMPPAAPLVDATIHHLQALLQGKLGAGVLVRTRAAFAAGPGWVVRPGVAVLPGRNADYLSIAPTRAHLVVEVTDGLSAEEAEERTAVYARAGVAVCWLVSLPDLAVECFRMPDRMGRRYRQVQRASGSDRLPLDAYPEAWIEAREVFVDETRK